ncbi:MAG: nicotinate-nucleotide adenylyltransferase [bacterium]|nr:nicotinate-nucleotide adenylyltransferase [bacterium]
MRVGLLGGTFDPPHNAHLQAAVVALQTIPLAEVWFLITGNPPHKNIAVHTPATFRQEMLAAALQSYPNFKICTIELETSGPHYTVNTLKSLQLRFPENEFHFLLGSDSYQQFSTWRDPEQILTLTTLHVFERPNHPILTKENVSILPVQPLNISSTMIRERIKMGLPIDGLVPDSVLTLIRACNFYRT